MKIERIWAMPNKWTFTIKPIKELLERYNVGKGWVDPFAGQFSPAEITNDHRPDSNAKNHLDAVEFSELVKGEFNGVLFDPPYSIHEVKRHYDSIGQKYDFANDPTCSFIKVRDNLANKIKIGGYVIYCGWNTNAFGKKRGFEIVEILDVAHGGNRNDTLVTVEIKVQPELLSTGGENEQTLLAGEPTLP
jgi:hypothetical protein